MNNFKRSIFVSGLAIFPMIVFAQNSGSESMVFSNPAFSAPELHESVSGAREIASKRGDGVESSYANGADTHALSEQEIAEINALKSIDINSDSGAGETGESILNQDARLQIVSTSYPATATALITFSGGRCTGWFIGANTVITAGHCVHDGGSSGDWKTDFKVYPGYTGSSAPFGSCGAVSAMTVSGWTANGDSNYDYGALKLDCTIGNSTGWFGLTTGGVNVEQPVVINGYPGDKPLDQWMSADKIRGIEEHRFSYRNDTTGGMSGSPVWYDRDDYFGFAVNGIHTLGGGVSNSATRINSTKFDNIVSWRDQ